MVFRCYYNLRRKTNCGEQLKQTESRKYGNLDVALTQKTGFWVSSDFAISALWNNLYDNRMYESTKSFLVFWPHSSSQARGRKRAHEFASQSQLDTVVSKKNQ